MSSTVTARPDDGTAALIRLLDAVDTLSGAADLHAARLSHSALPRRWPLPRTWFRRCSPGCLALGERGADILLARVT
ncbi:hypothetical protein QRX60_28620 [Amycolatopsis mongoliensis]|uniref:Uncharacterized protein n=1 Tax=Amycolatopsis mongoliensis TaxID=715475 RepID=A0A9Y2NB31_9PSEU|nr:hypothetical protein [Amycolatopsis sp. 4-36]WIX98036.1 hypothetical protein QRX60_28620 [Amycolatopsis sp. 4-36]